MYKNKTIVYILIGFLFTGYMHAQIPELVYDINTITNSSSPKHFIEYNGALYFNATNGIDGQELWKYDGVNPPEMVLDINNGPSGSNPEELIVVNGVLYFTADNATNGRELWQHNGTTTSMVADLGTFSDPEINELVNLNGVLCFTIDDGVNGDELWTYDGVNPPVMHEFYTGPSSTSARYLTVYNNELFFSGRDATLWN